MERPAEQDAEEAAATTQGYLIHKGNIHERRLAAVLARAFPLVFFVSTVLLGVIAAIRRPLLLLGLCAVFNLWTCLGMSLSGIYCLIGIWKMSKQLRAYSSKDNVCQLRGEAEAARDGPVHLIVIPNYMEEEEMMAETLQSLVEAEGSKAFHVALGIEDREGSDGKLKAERLKSMFAEHFARIEVTCHPGDLLEHHLDGSVDREVPGKASNLKWALRHLRETYEQEDTLDVEDVLLTVADADIIFHPGYFSQLTREFIALREAEGDAHLWTMWEAPQLPYRNLGTAPACSRVWAYVATTFEFGGVSGLDLGGHHIVFSTYSMPLQLAVNAQAHDGDVIAEDHHAHIKCLLYSMRAAALEGMQPGDGDDSSGSSAADDGECPSVRLRPIYLPSKATSVASSKGCMNSWVDRWSQAKRHARGVAELSYALLGIHDVVRLLPLHAYIGEALTLTRLSSRLFWIHMVPHLQCVLMAVLYCYWMYNNASMPVCSDDGSTWRTVLCMLAGTWFPAWPVGIPTVFLIPCNVLLISKAFLEPAAASAGTDLQNSKWYKEDGALPSNWGRSYVTALVAMDMFIFGGPVMVLYGAGTAILAFWGVCFCGNRFHYITASKATQSIGKPGRRSLVE